MTRRAVALARLTVTGVAVATVATTAVAGALPARAATSTPTISTLPSSAFTNQTFSVNGRIAPGTSAVQFQVQVSTPDHRAYRSIGTHRALGYVVIPLHFTRANVYSVRLAVVGGGVSRARTVTVTPPYPYVSITRRTFDLRTDAKTEQRVTFGTAIVDSSVTSCSIPSVAGSCLTSTPAHGRFVTVPVTIRQVKGRSSFAPYLFTLTEGGRTYSPVVQATGHGTMLSPGSDRAGQTTTGYVVFDAPSPSRARLAIQSVGSIGL